MYQAPELRRAYAKGVEKGRRIERKLCLILVIGFVALFEIVHKIVNIWSCR